MTIQICSDLHLEFPVNREWFKNNPLIPKGEVLIIAGDVYHLDKDFTKLDFIKQVSKDFEKVFIVPGNHEYYGGYDISTALETTHNQIDENVFIVNNYKEKIDDITFIFSTMWSKIEKHVLDIALGVTDFRKIKFKNKRFTPDHFNAIHQYGFEFISKAVNTEGKKIVTTHHLPSYDCMNKEFKKSVYNEAFCVEKKDFIANSDVDYWLFGHSHRNIGDIKIGNTQMISNQFGYINWNEHRTFDYEKVIEL